MHNTLKSILAALCQGHPLRWPQLLRICLTIMNHAVHTSTGQPYFAFFSGRPPRLVSAALPSASGEDEEEKEGKKEDEEEEEEMEKEQEEEENEEESSLYRRSFHYTSYF